jgi:hypothetical protein
MIIQIEGINNWKNFLKNMNMREFHGAAVRLANEVV